MANPDRSAGRDRARAAVASYERELGIRRAQEAGAAERLDQAREAGDDRLATAYAGTLIAAQAETARTEREVERFRRMAENGWQPPHPDSPEVRAYAAALRRANLVARQAAGRCPGRRDRALGERRPAPRRRTSRRSASRAGPSDPDDPDPPGEPTPPAGREQAGAA